MPLGRPTKYKPEYCEEIVDLLAKGYSITGAAGKLGVSRETIYEWARNHPDFSDALKVGKELSAAFWEERAAALASNKDAGNAAMIIFALKNRVANEWREKQEVEHSGSVGLSITVVDGFNEADDPE